MFQRVLAPLVLTGTLVPCALGASPQSLHCSERPLVTAPSAVAGSLGHKLSLDGRQVAVTQFEEGAGPGAVHLYQVVPPSGSWSKVSVLEDAGAPGRVAYGADVALSGNRMLVTDPLWANGQGLVRGRVHAFERSSPTQSFGIAQRFSAPVSGPLGFGSEILLRGEEAIISAPVITVQSPEPNLYVYRADAVTGDWGLFQEILPPAGTIPTSFGEGGMALKGDLLAVGDPVAPSGSSAGGIEGGLCYLYRRDPVSLQWSFEAALVPPVPQPGARFGKPEVISANEVAVAAELESDPGGVQAGGRVHIFAGDGQGNWSWKQTLRPDDLPPVGSALGFDSVSADEGLLVVGHSGFDQPSGGEQGRGVVYEQDGAGLWQPLLSLDRGAAGMAGELLGASVGVDSGRVVMGSPGASASMKAPGAAAAVHLDTGDCDGNQVEDACDLVAGTAFDRNDDSINDTCQELGVPYCLPGFPNSTGSPADLVGLTSGGIGAGQLQICGASLPPNEFGFLLGSSAPGLISMPGSSVGDLCLAPGADFGRFADQVVSSGQPGVSCTLVDFSMVPAGLGFTSLSPGDTWYFQFWYRDGQVSNFTTAIEVTVP